MSTSTFGTHLQLGSLTSTALPTTNFSRNRRPKKLISTIRTLRPDIIISQEEKVHDLSDITGPVLFAVDNRRCQLYYAPTSKSWLPFPPKTRGYLYYHVSPGHSELAGSIRFRLCESPEDFEGGRDPLAPSGQPWGYTLLELATRPVREVFLPLMLAEGFVDEETISDLAKLRSPQEHHRSPFLFSLAQPFVTNLAFMKANVRILTRKKLTQVDLKPSTSAQFMVSYNGKPQWISPLTGSVKLRLELSTLPEHVSLGPTLVLRVLEIVEPITMDPNFTGRVVVLPEPGTIVYRMKRGKKRVVCMPIHGQKMSADILELAKKAWLEADI
ncbi:hypothetical protein BDN70DRAFT_996477 [Pholiota conissans]|uniref:Uncharacterized protein n=1 Tax=Pholiota conissans TaxID=109636 RepID=A0A9P5YT95_9AGAR|nr:hypothetical protein BDN70DRAFT_996477 [Pholiota conissans]